jgi:hypothetical protein
MAEPDSDGKRKLDEVFSRLYTKIRDLAARIRWTGENLLARFVHAMLEGGTYLPLSRLRRD